MRACLPSSSSRADLADYKTAADLLEQAVALRVKSAASLLAQCYFGGKGRDKNVKLATKLWEEGRNEVLCCCVLGDCRAAPNRTRTCCVP